MTAYDGFNIQHFKSEIAENGVLQTNKFLVVFKEIPVLKQLSVSLPTLSLRAENVSWPGASLDLTAVHRYGIGPNQKFPTNVNFTDISITFIDTYGAEINQFMNSWLRYIFGFGGLQVDNGVSRDSRFSNLQEDYQLEYKKNYVTDVSIDIFNSTGLRVAKATLLDAYPISVNDVNLSWNDNNNLYKTSCVFNFRDYNINTNVDVSTSVISGS